MADSSTAGIGSVLALIDALNSAFSEAKPIVRPTTYAAFPDGSGGRAGVDTAGQRQPEEERQTALAAVRSRGGHVLDSWKVLEHVYRSCADSIFKVFPHLGKQPDIPTLARGLFTEQLSSGPRIAVRGYDKFFNVNEMPWTRVCIAQYLRCS